VNGFISKSFVFLVVMGMTQDASADDVSLLLQELLEGQQRQQEQIVGLNTAVAKLSGRLVELESNVAAIEDTQRGLRVEMNGVDGQFVDLHDRSGQLEDSVHSVAEFTRSMRTTVDGLATRADSPSSEKVESNAVSSFFGDVLRVGVLWGSGAMPGEIGMGESLSSVEATTSTFGLRSSPRGSGGRSTGFNSFVVISDNEAVSSILDLGTESATLREPEAASTGWASASAVSGTSH
jgi:hypothetical protein